MKHLKQSEQKWVLMYPACSAQRRIFSTLSTVLRFHVFYPPSPSSKPPSICDYATESSDAEGHGSMELNCDMIYTVRIRVRSMLDKDSSCPIKPQYGRGCGWQMISCRHWNLQVISPACRDECFQEQHQTASLLHIVLNWTAFAPVLSQF